MYSPAFCSPGPQHRDVLRRDGIQDNNSLKRGVLSFCVRVAVPNVCYEHLCACVMVAVAAVGIADSICAQQLLLLYPARLGYAGSEVRPCHHRPCALFHAPGLPNPEKRTMLASMLLAPYFWPSRFCSGWRVLIGVVQTVSRSGERCPPPGQDGRILRERYSRCRDRSHLEMQQNQKRRRPSTYTPGIRQLA